MNKNILLVFCLFVSVLTFDGLLLFKTFTQNSPATYHIELNHVEPMPIVDNDKFAELAWGGTPIEERNEKYRKWLSTGLKIQTNNASGSGTIIYFDSRDGYAYIQSCGHLWSGNMTAEEGKNRKITCKIITWYHNNIKLTPPKDYSAEVLYYSNTRGRDCSLLRFKPDWTPIYLPIAPADFVIEEGIKLHSVGCDGGREVAHYDVRYIGMQGNDLTTTENSPRPGRSGGGLMTEYYYIGICWGTTDISGNGNGFFTPLQSLREYNDKNGFGWLNEAGINWAQQIPIIDHNNPQQKYPKDYIPLPIGR